MASHSGRPNDCSALDFSAQLQSRHEIATPHKARRVKGQFFTPPEVSEYMASLFDVPRVLRLLDAGAGVGSLSAGVCDRIAGLPSPRSVDIHLFETDSEIIPLLRQTMERCRETLHNAGHELCYTIHEKDFILYGGVPGFQPPALFVDEFDIGQFDCAIMNPPYFKLSKDSAYARLMEDVVHGQPNIYALFVAAAASLLRPGGQLVAITPRSFCNGLYFRDFRRWLLARMSLEHIHLFESRTDTFRDVLQENLITVWRRAQQCNKVTLSTSVSGSLKNLQNQSLPKEAVLHGVTNDVIIRIPSKQEDAEILRVVEAWPCRLSELGLRVSTGPVVAFRAREFLLREVEDRDFAPLISVHNVKPFRLQWPNRKAKHPIGFKICQESCRFVLPVRNYVLLRRFSAKEEARRLTASPLLRSQQQWPYVALENHVNYLYHDERELTVEETNGLVALFNSVFLDRYFRTISGNTQVNATELRSMKFPSLDVVARLGRRLELHILHLSPTIEAIILDELGIRGPLRQQLLEESLFMTDTTRGQD